MGCVSSNTAETNPVRQQRSPPPVTTSRPSSPLVKSPPYQDSISQAQLIQQRQEFWSTRVDGNANSWQIIKSAAEAILEDNIMMANVLLEAGGITTPNGSLELCYDEQGHQYKTPIYCYCNPVAAGASPPSSDVRVLGSSPPSKPTTKSNTKTKPAAVTQPMKIKIRINPGDFNLQVTDVLTSDSVLNLKRVVRRQSVEARATAENEKFAIPICDESRQRIMYMGRELSDAQVLGDIGFDESRVLQIFLRPAAKPQ